MSEIKFTDEQVFLGRLSWSTCQSWARDTDKAPSEWFRDWSELNLQEQDRYVRISEALLTYFRAIEDNAILREELQQIKVGYETARLQLQKLRKENGGR